MTAGPCTAVRTGRCNCYLYLDPVCYKGKSYTNACTAACDGAEAADISQGECPSAPWSLKSVGEDTTECGLLLAPKCYKGKSFDNRCSAFLYGMMEGDYVRDYELSECAEKATRALPKKPAPAKNAAAPVKKPGVVATEAGAKPAPVKNGTAKPAATKP